jgi:hypothetical protein
VAACSASEALQFFIAAMVSGGALGWAWLGAGCSRTAPSIEQARAVVTKQCHRFGIGKRIAANSRSSILEAGNFDHFASADNDANGPAHGAGGIGSVPSRWARAHAAVRLIGREKAWIPAFAGMTRGADEESPKTAPVITAVPIDGLV